MRTKDQNFKNHNYTKPKKKTDLLDFAYKKVLAFANHH